MSDDLSDCTLKPTGHLGASDRDWIKVVHGVSRVKKLPNERIELTGPIYFACPGDGGKSVRFSDIDDIHHVTVQYQYEDEKLRRPTGQTNKKRDSPAKKVEKFDSEFKYKGLLGYLAAIQRGVDLAEGNSMTYDPETWEAEDVYEGTVKEVVVGE